jgi:hypothetical protein
LQEGGSGIPTTGGPSLRGVVDKVYYLPKEFVVRICDFTLQRPVTQSAEL